MIIPEPFDNKNYPTHNFIFQNKTNTTANVQNYVYRCNECNLIINYIIFNNSSNKKLYVIYVYFNNIEQLDILNCTDYIIKNIIE